VAYVLVGAAGFLLLLMFDWADSRGFRKAKPLIMIGAAVLFSFAFIAVLTSAERFRLPVGLRIAGGLFALLFLFLFVFSLFLEIPFSQTYAGKEGERRVVATGTYALVRHPGVIWFLFFHVCLVLAVGSKLLLLAVPFWTGMNIVLVTVEDRVFFLRTFGDSYRQYRRTVPFLIPTPASIRRCITTFQVPFLGRRGNNE
jgi:protein-S-isoprenylcysteine O-methyltransferase Ste14